MCPIGMVVDGASKELGLFERPHESDPLAAPVEDSSGVFFIPPFCGLDTPHADPTARGTIIGLGTGINFFLQLLFRCYFYHFIFFYSYFLLLLFFLSNIRYEERTYSTGVVRKRWISVSCKRTKKKQKKKKNKK